MIESTKLHIPHGRNSLVPRPSLMNKINEGMTARLTVVSAPAGYGKSTALSEWVKYSGSRAAWVSLDKQDNDWITFWSYVAAAVEEQIPGFGARIRPLLKKGSSIFSEPALDVMLNEFRETAADLVIILDDYHFISLPEIHDSLVYLLQHLPPHIHFFIAGRTDLAILSSIITEAVTVHKITMQDLSFQLDEGMIFFRETTDLRLTKKQVTQLYHQTEGWISGLQLAAIALKSSDNIPRSIDGIRGQHQDISRYLLEEMFSHLPEPIRVFLLETSILSRMNHSICEVVTGQPDCQEQLESLEQLNLFIIPLDDQRNWYRYHHLLSDFLQEQLTAEDPAKITEAHIHVAHWWEHYGFEAEAVEHYLEGEQYEDAVRLIEKNILHLLQSRSVVLNRWLSVIPEHYFAGKPMVEVFYISVLLGVGKWEAAFNRIKQAEVSFQTLQATLSEQAFHQAMGNIYFMCSVSAYLRKDLVSMSKYFEEMEQHIPEGSFFQTMGRNRHQGYDAFDDHLVYINDLHYAEETLVKWITVWESKREYPFVGFLFVSYTKLLYEWNRLEEAAISIHKALKREDIKPYARILIHLTVSAVRIHTAQGDPEGASELLSGLGSQIDSPDHLLFMKRVEAEQAFLALEQGRVEEARAWLQSCDVTFTDEVSPNLVAEHLILARVLAACEQSDNALQLLERMYQLLCKEDRQRGQIQVLILQSVLYQGMGLTETALVKLGAALQLAQPQGYIRSFIDEGTAMKELLTSYLKLGRESNMRKRTEVSTEYVERLLQSFE
ncbi:hypothetical protein H70357_12015 [Paenibacillus sp. FSL H7-0357]|uniref:hypothetical protein n=1 Tax=Paenibacillus sp. FSL H7-0357 TaxID=1536774 RepID=UPI0004F6B53F|nr:hypothetical protein [Paenibacillus sp. FSL H7-0357]AIQ17301.1 hypothetical protein H70357_12015 [Paenibacillus sp. FSL H7-0357]